MPKRLFALVFATLLLAACGKDATATQILVTVKATPDVAVDLRSLGVRTEWQDADGAMVASTSERPFPFNPLEDGLKLSFGVLPKEGSAQAVIRVTGYDVAVDAQGDKHILDVKSVTASFEKGAVTKVTVTLGEEFMDGGTDADAAQLPLCDEDAGVTEDCGVAVPSFVGAANWELLYAEGTEDITVLPGETWTFYTGKDGLGAGAIKHDGDEVRPVGDGVDEDTGIGFALIPQGDGEPSLAVFYMNSLNVPEGTTVTAVGDNALVLLSRTSMIIDGDVRADAAGGVAGAGGRPGLSEFAKAVDSHPQDGNTLRKPMELTPEQAHFSGAGGGANGGDGGNGGRGAWREYRDTETPIPSEDFAPGPGGAAVPAPASGPLAGGGGGGPGYSGYGIGMFSEVYETGVGGGGGGAIQLASGLSVDVGATGRVTALGAGGSVSASGKTWQCGPGAGGGAGGTIVIEAPRVTLAGLLVANGGGGAGGDSGNQSASPGADGAASNVSAAGSSGTFGIGIPTFARGGDGGDGAAGGMVDGEDGQDEHGVDAMGLPSAMRHGGAGGGGGGGAGRIVVRTLEGPVVPGANALISPNVGTSAVVLDGLMRVRALP